MPCNLGVTVVLNLHLIFFFEMAKTNQLAKVTKLACIWEMPLESRTGHLSLLKGSSYFPPDPRCSLMGSAFNQVISASFHVPSSFSFFFFFFFFSFSFFSSSSSSLFFFSSSSFFLFSSSFFLFFSFFSFFFVFSFFFFFFLLFFFFSFFSFFFFFFFFFFFLFFFFLFFFYDASARFRSMASPFSCLLP